MDNPPHPTAAALAQAALALFNETSFTSADSNKIARRAGFAPQTFYRWYKDKIAVFIACYRIWEDEEIEALRRLAERPAPPEAYADALIKHHRRYLLFRRNLRHQALENTAIRKARAESRLRQLEQIRVWTDRPEARLEDLALTLLSLERLLDAIAEGELTDMGLAESGIRLAIIQIISKARAEPPQDASTRR